MIERLLGTARSYIPDLNEKRLYEAFVFARDAHEGQLRKDGSPYITHPLSAALILTGLRVDEDTLIACLLHDVPEDTARTLEEIEDRFGEKVRFLVDGITKLSKVHYRNDMESRQIESLKKLFIHSAQDPRIILIKLADRLHNMQTIHAVPKPEKRERIARETLEIYVPIANLLGIWEIKNQLEDACFRILLPREYTEMTRLVEASEKERESVRRKTIQATTRLLRSKHIAFLSIQGRQKNLYGIYKKMLRTGKSFHEIYDLLGIRIIVDDVGTCYQTLGVLHQHFTPKIGRLKDYIAIPKSNGYQSIHTTVFGLNGTVTEFQIRTQEMHLENEYGIAAHYFYSNKKQNTLKKDVKKKYKWVQKILDLQRNISSNRKFLEHLKLDIFEDRIFVFTPKGDVVDLPLGANVIDLAYHIHSDLGMLAVSAEINGKPAPLTTHLASGDTVHVVTSEESEGPQVDWLDHVHTHLAKTRIREFLKEQDRTTVLDDAEEVLDHKLQILGLAHLNELSPLQKVIAMEHFKVETWEDLLYELGKGNIDISDLLSVLFRENELIGDKTDLLDVHVYDRNHARRLKSESVQKVHRVELLTESQNRVGLLRDLCNELANLGINIIAIQSLPRPNASLARMQFVLEIFDVKEYEKALAALRKVDGMISITRVQNELSIPIVPDGAQKKLAQ
jgi:GTP pyrophosphokinase